MPTSQLIEPLGSRTNFFDSTANSYDLARVPARPEDQDERADPNDRDGWVAHQILRQGASYSCPVCRHELEVESELSDPVEFVPKVVETEHGSLDLLTLPQRRRVCEDCGYISWGGILRDRPAEEFLAIVGDVLDALDLPPSVHKRHYRKAAERKAAGMTDKRTMSQLVADLRSN